MDCQRCRARPATIRLALRARDRSVTYFHVCAPCAKAAGIRRPRRAADWPEGWRPEDSLGAQLMAEVCRVDPELRAAMAEPGAGGVGFAFRDEDWPAVLAMLRTLPDDAGRARVQDVLRPFLPPSV